MWIGVGRREGTGVQGRAGGTDGGSFAWVAPTFCSSDVSLGASNWLHRRFDQAQTARPLDTTKGAPQTGAQGAWKVAWPSWISDRSTLVRPGRGARPPSVSIRRGKGRVHRVLVANRRRPARVRGGRCRWANKRSNSNGSPRAPTAYKAKASFRVTPTTATTAPPRDVHNSLHRLTEKLLDRGRGFLEHGIPGQPDSPDFSSRYGA